MLKPPSWPLLVSLPSPPAASVPPLTQPCHSPCTALNIWPALPAPSENPSVLWNSPPTTTTRCCLDPALFLFSISLNLLTSVVVLLPLQLSARVRTLCIWLGCSRIKSSRGTKGSCCSLSKIKHPLPLQRYVNNISRLNCSFFPGKDHRHLCYCPAFKLFCLCEGGKRHLAKPSPGGAGNCCLGLGKASASGQSCRVPNA